MMSTAASYASRSLLNHLAMVLSGFVAFLLLLDLMNHGDEVVQRHGSSALALAKYAALRVPDLATFILPFAVLIASLLMLAKFARSNEIMALKPPSPGGSHSGDWIRDGDSYVRIETVLDEGKELRGVTIFERQGHAV